MAQNCQALLLHLLTFFFLGKIGVVCPKLYSCLPVTNLQRGSVLAKLQYFGAKTLCSTLSWGKIMKFCLVALQYLGHQLCPNFVLKQAAITVLHSVGVLPFSC